MTPSDARMKCAQILDWAYANDWARENFDPSTIRSIHDQAELAEYDWPTLDQASAIENVYRLYCRAKSWGK